MKWIYDNVDPRAAAWLVFGVIMLAIIIVVEIRQRQTRGGRR